MELLTWRSIIFIKFTVSGDFPSAGIAQMVPICANSKTFRLSSPVVSSGSTSDRRSILLKFFNNWFVFMKSRTNSIVDFALVTYRKVAIRMASLTCLTNLFILGVTELATSGVDIIELCVLCLGSSILNYIWR